MVSHGMIKNYVRLQRKYCSSVVFQSYRNQAAYLYQRQVYNFAHIPFTNYSQSHKIQFTKD